MSRLAERVTRGITQCTEADLPELREFLEQTHPYHHVDRLPAASFDWLWRTNPNASHESTGIWICRRDGRIVGEQAELSFGLKMGDQHVRAAAAIELMVDPAWRLRGVGPALSEAQRRSVRVACALWMTEPAYKMYQRASWTGLGELTRRVLLVSPGGVLRSMATTKRRITMSALLPVASLMSACTRLGALATARRTRLVSTDAFDERSDEIWREVSPFYRVIARRDLESLRWRFDECPYAQHYERFYLLNGERPVGYIIVRMARWRNVLTLKVVDYLASPAKVLVLMAHTLKLARTHSAVVVEITTRNDACDRRLTWAGFLPVDKTRPRDDLRGIPFMVSVQRDDPLADIVTTADAWFMTSADGDMDLIEFSEKRDDSPGVERPA